MLQEPFGWEGCNVQFIWLISCPIVTYHCSFLSLKAMLFSYLHEVEEGGQALP